MLKVLLVDDDESLRQLLAYRFKQDFGFVVDQADSGHGAINKISQGANYSLIISDYNMPNGDGGELQDYLVKTEIKSFFLYQ